MEESEKCAAGEQAKVKELEKVWNTWESSQHAAVGSLNSRVS